MGQQQVKQVKRTPIALLQQIQIADVDYYIKWGDGDNIVWDGPYSSGETVTYDHIYQTQGTYVLKAKARDIYHIESDWEQITITIEKKSKNLIRETNFFRVLLFKLFQHYQKLFI